jgi:HD-GYP domain-containing protein (c-di-GMP phosphodiesterase class II)
LNKSGKFTEAEWQLMQSHPVLGVKALIRMRGFSESTIYRILVAHQHHIGVDGSGYPKRRKESPLHFFTKILSICDTFDAMTTARVYQKAMRPDEALRLMTKTVYKRYDPLLLKAFINTVGVFPIGTLVQLTNGEIGVVTETHPDAELMRQPKVKVVMSAKGQIYPESRVMDLSGSSPEALAIDKSLDPKEYRINIPHYILGDS